MSDNVNGSSAAAGQEASSMAVVLQPPTLPPIEDMKPPSIDGMVPPSLPPIDNNNIMANEDTKPSAQDMSSKRKQPPEEDNDDDTPKPKKKRNRAICSAEGCNNQVVNDGVCIKHGAQTKICSYEGKIYTYHISYDIIVCDCVLHAYQIYIFLTFLPITFVNYCFEGCNNKVQNNNVCSRHGAVRKTCTFEGCTSKWTDLYLCGFLCSHHIYTGTYTLFIIDKSQRGGRCMRHGASNLMKKCSHEGCTRSIVNSGV